MKSLIGAFTIAAFTGASLGQTFTYDFILEGLQEVPPNASPATGTGHVEIDTLTNLMSWHIEFSGLIAPQTAAHFHAPAAPGVNGPVVIPLPNGSPIIGSTTISDTVEGHLLAGLMYVNIHTTAFPGGEIRGQVVPTPAPLALLGLGAAVALRRRR